MESACLSDHKNTFFAYIGFAIQIYQYRRDLSTRD